MNRNNSISLPRFWDNSMGEIENKFCNNNDLAYLFQDFGITPWERLRTNFAIIIRTISVAQLTSNKEEIHYGPAAEFVETP